MIWLKKHTDQIQALIDEGTPESFTYAALRCRLALEAVCYHRLQVAHDYIAAKDIQGWQPGKVVKQLMREIDPKITASFTLSISNRPVEPDAPPFTREDFEAEEYFEVGRQIGFDSEKIAKIWQSLGSFLHVRLPRDSQDPIETFGSPSAIGKKVQEALTLLRDLEKGTLVTGGFGEVVKVTCVCGRENARRAAPLENGQIVSCINPNCQERWTVEIEGGSIGFVRRILTIPCHACQTDHEFQEMPLISMRRHDIMNFPCSTCGEVNRTRWILARHSEPARPPRPPHEQS
ncbi:hypothetical protein P7B02_15215 [Caulobacter segnis]|uniref:hypothetical protein n=1 Tax=Caulobacter segnis TaxID=88688 RepID=UPI0024107875|nr:hypothetical protein [Caulobacter segnis]MDG2522885.1 hypothetical protein [Caulobacter segnis]